MAALHAVRGHQRVPTALQPRAHLGRGDPLAQIVQRPRRDVGLHQQIGAQQPRRHLHGISTKPGTGQS
jgi:hypothetical protein